MKKVHILFTAALLVVGLGMAVSAEPCAGGKCCGQQGLRAGWFTGAGTLTQEGHNYKADGSCCTNAKADSKASGSCCGSSDSKAAGSCCSGKSDGKAAGECGGKCGGNCKK